MKILISIILLSQFYSNLIAKDLIKPRIIVFDFTGDKKKNLSIANQLTNVFREGILNSNQYDLVDRQSLNRVLKEKALKQKCGIDCDIDIGNYLQADYILVGKISSLKDSYIIDVKVTDLKKGIYIFSDSESSEEISFESLTKVSKIILEKFIKSPVQIIEEEDKEEYYFSTELTDYYSAYHLCSTKKKRLATTEELQELFKSIKVPKYYNAGSFWTFGGKIYSLLTNEEVLGWKEDKTEDPDGKTINNSNDFIKVLSSKISLKFQYDKIKVQYLTHNKYYFICIK
ncbi:MAG: CsgG/HfaB family protein [Leptospiraceae bacterium]|nr:CsgG/HfaB family protein [Leptospiraceae bacterium]